MSHALLVLVIVVVLFAAIYVFVVYPGKADRSRYSWLINTDFAHRGLYTGDQRIPENSIPAFLRAIENGFGMEMDVELTADDELLVFHDDALERMTGLKKSLWESTYDEVKALKLSGSGQKIPTFSDFLKTVDGRVPIIVEIKSTDRIETICQMTYDKLKEYHGNYCVESFNPFIVEWFRKNAPEVLRGQLSMRYTDEEGVSSFQKFVLENMLLNFLARPQFIAYYYKDRGKLSYKLCRRLGALTVAWTVNTPQELIETKKYFDTAIFEDFSFSRDL